MKLHFLTATVLAACLLVLAGCGASDAQLLKAKQEAAVKSAQSDFQSFRQATTGLAAEQIRSKIKDELLSANLSLDAIGVTDNELQARQSQLYNADAEAAASQLHNTHRNSQGARELANQCRTLKDKAHQPVSPALEKGLELAVARNMREESDAIKKAHGVLPAKKRPIRRTARR